MPLRTSVLVLLAAAAGAVAAEDYDLDAPIATEASTSGGQAWELRLGVGYAPGAKQVGGSSGTTGGASQFLPGAFYLSDKGEASGYGYIAGASLTYRNSESKFTGSTFSYRSTGVRFVVGPTYRNGDFRLELAPFLGIHQADAKFGSAPTSYSGSGYEYGINLNATYQVDPAVMLGGYLGLEGFRSSVNGGSEKFTISGSGLTAGVLLGVRL